MSCRFRAGAMAAIAMLAVLAGCYGFSGGGGLPSHMRTVWVAPIENESTQFGIAESLMDELYLWFRTTSDVKQVERYTSQLSELIRGRCPLIVELSCYHVGSFQDPKLMLEAARVALANGAESVGMYRGHAVDQLNFWPLIEEIRSLG